MPVSSAGASPTPSSPEPLDHHPARSWTRSVSWLVMADDRFLRALRRERVDRTPVWFMRQAGRDLPEYRELRGDRDILESIRRPEEAVEITMQPLRRMPLDAAIVFSDIVVPLAAVGLPIRIVQGRGPVLDEPIHDAAGLTRLRPLEPDAGEPYLVDTVRLLAKELDVPLIGFAGAPFTLASYLIEGGPSRDHARTKALLWTEPAVWDDLLDRLVTIVVAHVGAQVEAGAGAIHIFGPGGGTAARRSRRARRRSRSSTRGSARWRPPRTPRRSRPTCGGCSPRSATSACR